MTAGGKCATCRHWGPKLTAPVPPHLAPYLDQPLHRYRWCRQGATDEDLAAGDATASTAEGSCDGWEGLPIIGAARTAPP